MVFFKNFKKFIKEYRIIGVSIGFVVAIAASNFLQSVINDIFLPILRPFVSSSVMWEDMVFSIGSINIRIGSFLSKFLNLITILLILYLLIVKLMKWKPKK